MKLTKQNTSVMGGLGGKVLKANISLKNSAKLWAQLQNPYKNPIGSIVREITSNCFDAHKDAGVDDAVVINIDKDDNGIKLSFVDVGIGMSPDVIENVYISYLESTKEETNDMIGAFGIGSKSPLSYVDIFYIDTISDGMLYKYMMRKGDEGPELNELSNSKTKERNGTTISFYLKKFAKAQVENSYYGNLFNTSDDFSNFIKEIHKQLFYFTNVYVNMSTAVESFYYGCRNLDHLKDLIEEINTATIYENDIFNYRHTNNKPYSNLHICLGPVTYPIDWEILGLTPINVPLGLKFNIGDLPIIHTREDIKYDNSETFKIISKRIEELKTHIGDINKNVFNVTVDTPYEYNGLVKLRDERFYSIDDNNPGEGFNHPFDIPWKPKCKLYEDVNCYPSRYDTLSSDLLAGYNVYKSVCSRGKVDRSYSRHIGYSEQMSKPVKDIDKNIMNKLFIIKGQNYNVRRNKYIASAAPGLGVGNFVILREKKRDLKFYKEFLRLKWNDRINWRKRINAWLKYEKEHLGNFITDYDKVTPTKAFIDSLGLVKKSYDKTKLLLQEYIDSAGNYGRVSYEKTYIDLKTIDNHSGLVFYTDHDNKDELKKYYNIFNNTINQKIELSNSFTKDYQNKVILRNNSSFIGYSSHRGYHWGSIIPNTKLKRKKYDTSDIKFVTVAASKAKYFDKNENAYDIKNIKDCMEVIKRMGISLYAKKASQHLFRSSLSDKSNDNNDFAKLMSFLKIVNTKEYNKLVKLVDFISFNCDNLLNTQMNEELSEEVLEVALEKDLIPTKEIDDLIASISKYNNIKIDVLGSDINSVANIINYVRLAGLRINNKFYLKQSIDELKALRDSVHVEDNILYSYLKLNNRFSEEDLVTLETEVESVEEEELVS